jgi:hypothetical protein
MSSVSSQGILSLCVAVLLAATTGCGRHAAPTAPGPEPTPTPATTTWDQDAVALAIDEMDEPGSSLRDSIDIPLSLFVALRDALIAVDQAKQLPARDTVVAIYDIHHFSQPKSLLVSVDTTQAWAAAWWRGEALTGNAVVDSLVRRYGLTLRNLDFPWAPTVVLTPSRDLHVSALVARFAPIPGVLYAQPNYRSGDGPTIWGTREPDAWRLDYEWAWGDCESGCIAHEAWSFRVRTDGSVEYLGYTNKFVRPGRT